MSPANVFQHLFAKPAGRWLALRAAGPTSTTTDFAGLSAKPTWTTTAFVGLQGKRKPPWILLADAMLFEHAGRLTCLYVFLADGLLYEQPGQLCSHSSGSASHCRKHVFLDVDVRDHLELALDVLCQGQPELGKCIQTSKYARYTHTQKNARQNGIASNRESLATYVGTHVVDNHTACPMHAAGQLVWPAQTSELDLVDE